MIFLLLIGAQKNPASKAFGLLLLYLFNPGIFARGLIKMSMNAKILSHKV